MRRFLKGFVSVAMALLVALLVVGCGSVEEWDGSVGDVPGAASEEVREEPAVPEDSGQDGREVQSAPDAAAKETEASSEDAVKAPSEAGSEGDGAQAATSLDESGSYTSRDEVALYIHTYGHLPDNFVTKSEAQDQGWKTEGLSLGEACPGKSIGGDRFGNREGLLPKAKGRIWYECDIDTNGGSRGAKRIVFSNDGLIYYTEDHYKSFVQLY